MEGLEVSVVSFKSLLMHSVSLRTDSEYFKKEYLIENEKIKRKKYSKLIAVTKKIDVGFVGPMKLFYCEDGILLIQTKNIGPFFLTDTETIKITKAFHHQINKSQVNRKDILIARSGSFGKASIYLENETINSSDIILIQANEAIINSFYLVAFLNCSYGVNQMMRFASGGLQGHVNLTILEELKVPILNTEFQLSIENILNKAYKCKKDAFELYSHAETLLLQSIGLQDFKPSTEAVNIKSFKDSFGISGRLDAEFYQPKYEEIINVVKSNKAGFSKLETYIKNYSTGFPYKSESYSEVGIPLIRINNIQNGELELSNSAKVPFSDISLSPKDVANENDILISMSGTIGNSCKLPNGVMALVNQRVMRITSQNIDTDVLPLLINSVIGKYQLERIGTGGVQTNISSTDIKEILIPIIEEAKQKEIASLAEESFRLKKQSEHLLEVAKKAVEMAIEEGEERALEWIEEARRASI